MPKAAPGFLLWCNIHTWSNCSQIHKVAAGKPTSLFYFRSKGKLHACMHATTSGAERLASSLAPDLA
jgi:hypothetical protein